MSQKVEFDHESYYNILAVAAGDKGFAGASHRLPLPPTQPVHINADTIKIWHLDSQAEPGVFRLWLDNAYPYIGVDAEGNVIGTHEWAKDRQWKIRYWNSLEAFSIDFNDDIRPTRTWSLSSDTPDAKIVIRTYEDVPDKSQVFKIVQLLE